MHSIQGPWMEAVQVIKEQQRDINTYINKMNEENNLTINYIRLTDTDLVTFQDSFEEIIHNIRLELQHTSPEVKTQILNQIYKYWEQFFEKHLFTLSIHIVHAAFSNNQFTRATKLFTKLIIDNKKVHEIPGNVSHYKHTIMYTKQFLSYYYKIAYLLLISRVQPTLITYKMLETSDPLPSLFEKLIEEQFDQVFVFYTYINTNSFLNFTTIIHLNKYRYLETLLIRISRKKIFRF